MLKSVQSNSKEVEKPQPKEQQSYQNFTIYSTREAIAQQVFKPGWNLPTMTIEEWAERQMQLGLLPNPNATNRTSASKKEKVHEDEKQKQKRDWDDWKDEHTKGEGNKNDNYFRR